MGGGGWPETSVAWPVAPPVPPAPSSLFPFLHRMVEYSLDLQNINLSAIRTVRVLRPLKAINRVPSELTPLPPSLAHNHLFTQKRLTTTFQCQACAGHGTPQ